MEDNIAFVEKSLVIWKFAIENIETNKIKYVHTHEWKRKIKDKPLLYTNNLQCCVALYAYGNNFGFLSHINTVVFANDEYYLDENKKPICCNRCEDLYKSILNYKGIIKEPFKIGIAIGSLPLDKNEKSIILIYQGIKNIIKKLNYLGIKVIELEDIYAPEFILDSETGNIILPNNKMKTKHL